MGMENVVGMAIEAKVSLLIWDERERNVMLLVAGRSRI